MGIHIDLRTRIVLVEVRNLEKATKRQIRRGLYMVGRDLKSTASTNILKKPRMGRVYRYRGRRHVASVPGESWANRSGKTRRGIVYNVVSARKMEFGNTEKVGRFMEDGTPTIKPRPAHLISIRQNNRNIVNILESHVGKALGK